MPKLRSAIAASAAALAAVALLTHSAAADKLRGFKVGAWDAGAYSYPGSRRFSHCAASGVYNSGVAVFFSVDRGYRWRIMFASPRFKLRPGQAVRLGLSIDGERPTMVTGEAPKADLVRIELAPTAALFNKFRHGHELRLLAEDQSYTFNLTGTSRMLAALLDCVTSALNPTPMQTAAAPAGRPGSRADHRAEATAVIANLLSQAGVAGFRIVPAGDDEIGRTAEVVWQAGAVGGLLLIVHDRGIKKPADAAPQLIALSAKSCKGAFLSGSIPDEAGGAQARVFTTCQAEAGSRTTYFLTMARKAGGHYVFATFADGDEAPAKDADAGIRAAALKVVE